MAIGNYNFKISKADTKEIQKQKKRQVIQLFQNGYTASQITRMGYNSSSVYRWINSIGSTGEM